jgi:AAA domain
MSSTRTAKDKSVFHQGRYASSPEFERGLLAYLVAKRCAIIESATDRELIWFVQYLSHREGGLAALASDLLDKYRDRIGTETMAATGKKDSQNFTADEIRKIRLELPFNLRSRYPLKGETKSELRDLRGKVGRLESVAENARALRAIADEAFQALDSYEDMFTGRREEEERLDRERAIKHPTTYGVTALREICRRAAVEGLADGQQINNLERELAEMCLNPEWKLSGCGPWYFSGLVAASRDYKDQYVKAKSAGIVVTALGRKVCDLLDYTLSSRTLTLTEGNPRLGKSFAARTWCELHPGQARFVEVPPSNDEASFFRAIARGLGIGNFLQYKVTEIRERVESVLLSGDLLLVLDEAHRLWPQRNFRYGFPSRINWVMAMANHSVPICAVATPQFIQWHKAAEEKWQWNSAQLTGRISHYEPLPTDLDPSDLMAVAKSVLPEADNSVLRALAVYARSSARYLAAIDSIAKRARFIAMRADRKDVTTADVRKAMQESVIPADSKLLRALESGRKSKPIIPARVAQSPAQTQTDPPARTTRPTEIASIESPSRAGSLDLIKG